MEEAERVSVLIEDHCGAVFGVDAQTAIHLVVLDLLQQGLDVDQLEFLGFVKNLTLEQCVDAHGEIFGEFVDIHGAAVGSNHEFRQGGKSFKTGLASALLLFKQYADQFARFENENDRCRLEDKTGVAGKASGTQLGHDFWQFQLGSCQVFKQGVAFGKKEHLCLLSRIGFSTAS